MRVLLVLLFFVIGTGGARAEAPRQFNNIIYTPPAGWVHGYSTGPWILLIPEDPNTTYCNSCYFYIGTGSPGAWDAKAYLTTQQRMFVEAEDWPNIVMVQLPDAASVAGRLGALLAQNINGKLLLTVAVTLSDRVEVFAFEGPGADQAQATATFQVFAEQFEPFIASLGFVSEGAAPLFPAAEPGPMTGLWWGWHIGWVPTMNYQMRMEIYHDLYAFWPDGHFYQGTPSKGLAPVDRAAMMAAGDLHLGTYSVEPDGLHLTYSNGLGAIWPREGTGWKAGESVMKQVETYPDGTTIDGKLASNFFAAFNPYGGMAGSAFSMSEVLFFPDGHWESSYFASASGNLTNVLTGENTGDFNSSSGIDSQHGTYVVKDGVVIQSPADGSAPVVSFIFKDGDNILIGEQMLEPRE